MYSGHPMGLFPSTPAAPRAVITNGMVGLAFLAQDFHILSLLKVFWIRKKNQKNQYQIYFVS